MNHAWRALGVVCIAAFINTSKSIASCILFAGFDVSSRVSVSPQRDPTEITQDVENVILIVVNISTLLTSLFWSPLSSVQDMHYAPVNKFIVHIL